jgi:ribonuclease T1
MTQTFKIYFFAALALAGLTAYFNPQPVATNAATHLVAHSQLRMAKLPPEAQKVWRTIQTNGPFAYPKKDGEIFGNFEKKLPIQPHGFYRAYTVPTKGLGHRGPKRLITGGRSKTKPDMLYYTTDHYQSFSAIKF